MTHHFRDTNTLMTNMKLYNRKKDMGNSQVHFRDHIKWLRVDEYGYYQFKTCYDEFTPFRKVNIFHSLKSVPKLEEEVSTRRLQRKTSSIKEAKLENLREQLQFIREHHRWCVHASDAVLASVFLMAFIAATGTCLRARARLVRVPESLTTETPLRIFEVRPYRPHTPASLAREPGSTRLEIQIRQCMDNKEPSRVKFRRVEPDPPLLAVRLGSGISSPVYGALRIGLVPPPPKNLFILFSLLQAKRYAPLVPQINMADSKLFMSPDFLTTFIEEYRNLPCLWKVRSAEYSNKFKRDTAWEHLLQITKEKIPNADTNFVKRKVDDLRAAFRKEMRKVRDRTRSGASADDTYTPTLWYFELMKFTAEQEQPRKTKSNLDEDEENIIEEEGNIVEEELNEGDVNNGDNEQTLNRGSPSTAAKRRKTSPKKNKTKNDRAEE
ncbi:hypothetical protein J6590_103144 [Homalodisca vitripennis]|nr:hypothetical protein J6590_103144 [Homalodisca vitripennis]